MKKTLVCMLVACSLGSLVAGEYGALSDGAALFPVPAVHSGLNVGISGSYLIPTEGLENELGTGVSVGYLVNEYVSLELGASLHFSDSEIQNYTLDILWYVPNLNTKNTLFGVDFNPYLLVGAGVHANSVITDLYRLGAGVSFDVLNLDSTDMFVDGIYTFTPDESVEDYTIFRVGVRYQF